MRDHTLTVADARTRFQAAKAELETAQKAFNASETEILKARATELQEEHPEITKVGFTAYYSYDDEGSYYWSVQPQLEMPSEKADEEVVVPTRWDPDRTYSTRLIWHLQNDEVLVNASVDAWQAATGAEDDGESMGGWIGHEGQPEEYE